jgi:hypothetical protein
MDRDHDESYAQSESTVAEGVRRVCGDAPAVVRIVADEVAGDLRKSGSRGTAMLSTISALADGTARGAADARAGIGFIAEGFMIGAMRGADETPERTLAVIGHAADSFVKHAHQSGFDAAAAARGLVEGAAAWAGHCALDASAAADAAARGAADAAEDMSPRIGRRVREALLEGLVPGAPTLLETTVPKARS